MGRICGETVVEEELCSWRAIKVLARTVNDDPRFPMREPDEMIQMKRTCSRSHFAGIPLSFVLGLRRKKDSAEIVKFDRVALSLLLVLVAS